MQSFTFSEIADAIGCSIDRVGVVTEIVTDSRKAVAGTAFVAIKGENFDGNDFVASALLNGASLAITDVEQLTDDARVLKVADSKRALIAIGAAYRDRFSLPIVGVTGSVGKTTTKEFIYCVLSVKYNTLKNEGNQNNEIGVPNTLFCLTEDTTAAVIEMGMCALGEIADLSHAVRPTIGVITGIGISHLEALGSRENILKAKLEIIGGMEAGAPLFLNGDDDYLNTFCNKNVKIYRYSTENEASELRAVNIVTKNGQTSFGILSPWGEAFALIPTIGLHNVMNALVAFGVGCAMGIKPTMAANALLEYSPAGMRQKIVSHNGYTVVEDCYNSSPDSLTAACKALEMYPTKGRRIMVVSDMLELGVNEAALHRECGEMISNCAIDCLYATGTLSENIISAANTTDKRHFSTKDELCDFLLTEIRKDDVVWFKASRGIELEQVIYRMYK